MNQKAPFRFYALIFGLPLLLFLLSVLALSPHSVAAQEGIAPTAVPVAPEVPERVDVEPVARDEQIEKRLENILRATGWFIKPDVTVQDGVVFLQGGTGSEEFKKWAGDLARNTQDVAAVVNQIDVIEPSIWDIQPAVDSLRRLGRSLVRAIPLTFVSILILLFALGVARLTVYVARYSLTQRFDNPLVTNVIVRSIGLAVFLIGLYVVFHVAGLTGVAFTVLGGTGLFGLVVGIAFRDITENFLASIFLSIQNPFRTGDLVEIAGIVGFVQMLTTRTTVLMTPEGNHVQIPNSTVYNSNIYNFTSNPNRRQTFKISISYQDEIAKAQAIALKVLQEHPALLKEPEPLVLVESLGSSGINMQISFWLNGNQHSPEKVKSSVIRLVKKAFAEAGIKIPDTARERIWLDQIPLALVGHRQENVGEGEGNTAVAIPSLILTPEPQTISTAAEGGLRSEASEIEEQVRHSRSPEEGENLLKPSNQ